MSNPIVAINMSPATIPVAAGDTAQTAPAPHEQPAVTPPPAQSRQSASPMWIDRGHIPGLDGLRAVAVGLVVLSHLHLTRGFPAFPYSKALDRVGVTGVDIFFVLSGFLITTLLCREFDRTGRISLRGFYLRRALRILPAYLSLLAVVALMQAGGLVSVPAIDWLAAATYTMNFREHPVWELGHTWSLSIEEHFYLLWPPVFFLASRKVAFRILVAILLIGPAVRWAVLLRAPEWAPMTELWTFTRIDSIAFGCLFALLARNENGRRGLDRLGRLWPAALALLVAAVGLSFISGKFSVGVAPTLIASSVAVLVWATVRNTPRWLEHPAVVTVGVGSYGLYIWQQLFLNPWRETWWTAFPQNVVLAALTALISYRVVERPFLKLKDGFGAEKPTRHRVEVPT